MQATSFLEWNSLITCLTRCCTNSRDKGGAGDAGYHRIVPSSGAVPPEKRDCSSSDERETSCCQLKHGWAELQAPNKIVKKKEEQNAGKLELQRRLWHSSTGGWMDRGVTRMSNYLPRTQPCLQCAGNMGLAAPPSTSQLGPRESF